MNKLKLWGCVSAAALMLAACDDTAFIHLGDGEGRLAVTVDLDSRVVSNTTVTHSRAADGGVEAEDVKISDLTLAITSVQNGGTVYLPLADFDQSNVFPAGTYKVEVFYGDNANEGFGLPYYYGKAAGDVVVRDGETTAVALTAELANSMFTVAYSDNMDNYLTSYEATLASETGAEPIAYPADSTRRAYMHAGELVTVKLQFTKKNGNSYNRVVATKLAEPKKHYKVSLDVKGEDSSTEGAQLTVTFDDSLDEGETQTISLDDAALSASAPTIETEGFDDKQEIAYTEGAAYADDLKFSIYAPGKLKSVKIDTDNAALIEGWAESIELIGASPEQQEALKALGLYAAGVWRNPDQMAVINLKDVVQHIALPGNDPATVTFTVTATDQVGQSESKQVSLTIEKLQLQLAISNPSPATMALGETQMTFDLKYNGPAVEDNVKFRFNDALGTEHDCTVAYTATGDDTYTAALSDLPTSGDFKVIAEYIDGDKSNQINIKRTYPDIEITVSDNDVWATTADFTVLTTDGKSCLPDAFTACAYVKKAGTSDFVFVNNNDPRTVNVDFIGDKLHLSILEPGTTYELKVSLSGNVADMQGACTFTTEAATQLPNADMETWCQTSSGNNWELVYPGASAEAAVWGTNNPMTTSQGADLAYCRISGTISTDDSPSGKAALIRTVGWGSDNTAMGSSGSSGKTKYVDAGLLHLGSSRSERPSGYSGREGALTTDDLDCGLAWASRPKSLSFWYKYSPKNSADKGYAEVQVIDADGTVIASKVANLDGASAYTQVTLPLAYAEGAPKAAKIYVKFLSTNDRKFLEKSNDNLSGPGFANLSRGTFMGSQLYIDDITLNY